MNDLRVVLIDGVCHTVPIEGSPREVGLQHSFVFWKLQVRIANGCWGQGDVCIFVGSALKAKSQYTLFPIAASHMKTFTSHICHCSCTSNKLASSSLFQCVLTGGGHEVASRFNPKKGICNDLAWLLTDCHVICILSQYNNKAKLLGSPLGNEALQRCLEEQLNQLKLVGDHLGYLHMHEGITILHHSLSIP